MATTVKDVLIKFTTNTKALDKAEKDIKDLSKAEQEASNKRKRSINEEKQDLLELRKRRKKAFELNDVKAYNNRIDETKKRIKTLERAHGDLEKKGTKLGTAFKRVGGQIAAAFAVERLVSFTAESVKLAAEAEGVGIAFRKIADDNFLEKLETATKGTVSQLELMRSTVTASNFKIPLENLPKLFAFATQRAVDTGVSVQGLTRDIVTGIGRKSVKIIDNLGISASAVREEFAKTRDFAQAVTNIIDREMPGAGDQFLTAAQKLQKLNATWDNFKISLGEGVFDVMEKGLFPSILEWVGLVDITNDTLKEQEAQIARNNDTISKYEKQIDDLDGTLFSEGSIKSFKEMIKRLQAQNIALERQIKLQKDNEVLQEESTNTLKAWREEVALMTVQLDGLDVGSVAFQNTLNRINKLQSKIKDATKDLSKELKKIAEDELRFDEGEELEGDSLIDAMIGFTDKDEQNREEESKRVREQAEKLREDISDASTKANEEREAKQLAQLEFDKMVFEQELILNQSRIDTAKSLTSALSALAGDNVAAQKAAFIANKGIAIAQILLQNQLEIAAISTAAALNPANAVTGGLAGVAQAATLITAAKTRTALSIATVVATTIGELGGFEEGGYTGDLGTKDIAGVIHGKEFVIDAPTTKKMGLKGKDMDDFNGMLDNGTFSMMSRNKEGKQEVGYIYKGENVEGAINQMRKQNAVNARWTADRISKSLKEDKFIKSHTFGN